MTITIRGAEDFRSQMCVKSQCRDLFDRMVPANSETNDYSLLTDQQSRLTFLSPTTRRIGCSGIFCDSLFSSWNNGSYIGLKMHNSRDLARDDGKKRIEYYNITMCIIEFL